jgi:transposase InsO family protein
LGITIRTVQRWKKDSDGKVREDQRQYNKQTPANKLSLEERQTVLEICNSERFHSLPPSQIVPALADEGIYIASESSFYRILHQKGLQKHRGKSHPKKAKPKAFIAVGPNQVWTWDITYLPSYIKGVFFYLYMIIDIYSRKIVGWEVHCHQRDELSSELIKKTCFKERIYQDQLILHSDNGSPMKGATMLATLQHLGVIPSFSRPSVSNDNPYSESLFKTLKYTPIYPAKPFDNLETVREWVLKFVNWYNNEHYHSGIKFVTPNIRHNEQDSKILKTRDKVYKEARKKRPERWSGNTRNWSVIKQVSLNPEKTKKAV